MPLIRTEDLPLPPGPPSSYTIALVVEACIAEIVLALLVYGIWGFRKLRNGSTSSGAEIKRFIISFLIVFAIVNPLWFYFLSTTYLYPQDLLQSLSAIQVAVVACIVEIVLALLIYRVCRHGRSTTSGNEIKWFILIFVVVFTIINGLWIITWAKGSY